MLSEYPLHATKNELFYKNPIIRPLAFVTAAIQYYNFFFFSKIFFNFSIEKSKKYIFSYPWKKPCQRRIRYIVSICFFLFFFSRSKKPSGKVALSFFGSLRLTKIRRNLRCCSGRIFLHHYISTVVIVIRDDDDVLLSLRASVDSTSYTAAAVNM